MNNERKCDPNDVICKMEVLRHLKGLEQQLGSEQFQEEFPEAASLAEKISAKVSRQEQVVDEALAICGDEEETVPPGE